MDQALRNIAIVAHVDHGKTTLIDRLLQQSGARVPRSLAGERMLDTNDLERERGITILAKNTAIDWEGYRINIVDTPGHADFGGEVERILSMVDSVLLLVDAVEGPMPQTRFVTQKALARSFRPIVVINKVDRPAARPQWVLNETFDLFDRLGADERQLDFPVLYASALEGWAAHQPQPPAGPRDMRALFETVIAEVPQPDCDPDGPFQMQVSSLDYSSYVGTIGIGRIARGRVTGNMPVTAVDRHGAVRGARILQVLGFTGLERQEIQQAQAGDIVAVTGVDGIQISDTLCDPDHVQALPALSVDEPTVRISVHVNNSPFAGREGKFVTSRQVRARLERELEHNVALGVDATDDPDRFSVSGRGELHLAILLENMRREGYEFAVGRPQTINKYIEGVLHEPIETLVVDVEDAYQGAVMELIGERRGELQDMRSDGAGRVRLDYSIPARSLIGFRTEYLSASSGTGVFYHAFKAYAPVKAGPSLRRRTGVLIANGQGRTLGFALFNLQERGRLFVGPGEEVYEGMIVGSHTRANDLTVNPMRAKQLTNIRAAGADENVVLTPPLRFDLERAMEFIEEDELVEVTPKAIRLRKKLIKEHERRRAARTVRTP